MGNSLATAEDNDAEQAALRLCKAEDARTSPEAEPGRSPSNAGVAPEELPRRQGSGVRAARQKLNGLLTAVTEGIEARVEPRKLEPFQVEFHTGKLCHVSVQCNMKYQFSTYCDRVSFLETMAFQGSWCRMQHMMPFGVSVWPTICVCMCYSSSMSWPHGL